MMLRRLALLTALVAPIGVLWAACSVPGRAGESPDPTCVEGCPEADAAIDVAVDSSQIGVDARPDGPLRNARCGTTGCVPDLDQTLWTCGGSLIQQGASTRPGSTLDPQPLGDGAGGGGGGGGGGGAAPVLACQVISKAKNVVAAECVAAGAAKVGEVCRGDVVRSDGTLASDCEPGLACVRAPGAPGGATGQCRPYCCRDELGCAAGSWCTQRPLVTSVGGLDAFVPVCAPAQNCALLEPGACPDGQACVLVAPLTTTCNVPGDGLDGQSCSCAEGYVCMTATKTCRQLCRLGAPDGCARGVCSGGGDVLPPGIGLCVGD